MACSRRGGVALKYAMPRLRAAAWEFGFAWRACSSLEMLSALPEIAVVHALAPKAAATIAHRNVCIALTLLPSGRGQSKSFEPHPWAWKDNRPNQWGVCGSRWWAGDPLWQRAEAWRSRQYGGVLF